MMYKAIILDIDGTAIPNAIDGVPSRAVKEAIKKAQQSIPVCIATGRPLSIAKRVIRALGITDYCATSDSTLIYNPKTDTVIRSFPLLPEAAQLAKEYLIAHHIPFMVGVENDEYMYTGKPLPQSTLGLAVPEMRPDDAEKLIQNLTHIPNISVIKVNSFLKDRVWVTITSSVATKLHAVIAITELLGVDPKEVIGVGDGYNDYPLLSMCGLKVAMGNAVPELKAIADFVAPSVAEDGVAVVIKKFILSSLTTS